MDTEFEVKYYGIDKDNLRLKLKAVGAKLVAPERKMRRVIYDEMFHKEFKCDFVRVRDEGNKITMTAKTHAKEGRIQDAKETEIIIDNYDKAIEIFAAMGYTPDRYQETLRESWILDGCHIDIDTWPGLDTYCEIEGNSEADIKKVSDKLEFDWSKHFVSDAVSIYANVYQLSIEEVLKLAANSTFENNPFAKFKKHDYNYSISS
jgi:adenylate cyclase class 2